MPTLFNKMVLPITLQRQRRLGLTEIKFLQWSGSPDLSLTTGSHLVENEDSSKIKKSFLKRAKLRFSGIQQLQKNVKS